MKKFITYEEKELKEVLEYIEHTLNNTKFWADMMMEQHEGKRENITMSDSREILSDVEKIKNTLKSFKL